MREGKGERDTIAEDEKDGEVDVVEVEHSVLGGEDVADRVPLGEIEVVTVEVRVTPPPGRPVKDIAGEGVAPPPPPLPPEVRVAESEGTRGVAEGEEDHTAVGLTLPPLPSPGDRVLVPVGKEEAESRVSEAVGEKVWEGDALAEALPLGERERESEEEYDEEVEGERVGRGLAVPLAPLLVPLTLPMAVTLGVPDEDWWLGKHWSSQKGELPQRRWRECWV